MVGDGADRLCGSQPMHNASDRSFWISASEASRPFYVGLDLGGTNIKAGIVDEAGRTVAYHSEPSRVDLGPDDVARRLGGMVGTLCTIAGIAHTEIAGVGLGTPGPQNLQTGVLYDTGNMPGFEGFPIRDRVAEHCGLAVTFANDATAAAYGEFWIGSGRNLSSMVFWTLGTGIGGGVIIGDACLEGHHSHATECGHIIVDTSPDARDCPCGKRGHLEAYASATSLVAMAKEQLAAGATGLLADRVAAGELLTPVLMAEAARQGDSLAMNLILEAARWMGIGTVTLMHIIDPEGVILGGAMTFDGEGDPIGSAFLERVRQEVRTQAFPVLARETTIHYAALGGDAGYIGAAGLARVAARRKSN
jgi:glucokinase